MLTDIYSAYGHVAQANSSPLSFENIASPLMPRGTSLTLLGMQKEKLNFLPFKKKNCSFLSLFILFKKGGKVVLSSIVHQGL